MLTTNSRQLGNIWGELEAGLGCGAQFRVLLHLALHPEEAFTKYALVKATGLRTPAVQQQLNRLVELGWARRHESTPTTHQISLNNEVVRIIHGLFVNLKGIKFSQ